MRHIFLALLIALAHPAVLRAQPCLDSFGDSLPAGAVHRLGSIRLRPVGHTHRLALSPDGKTLATSSGDGVQFWDPNTGKLVRHWNVDGGYLAYSPDGNWLAIGNYYKDLHLRDAHSGKLKVTVKHGGLLAYSPDGKLFACALGRHQLVLIDTATGKMTKYLGEFSAVCLAFSPDSKYLAGCSGTDSPHDTVHANVWEVATGKRVCSLKHERGTGTLQGVAFAPDSKRFLVSSFELTLHDVDSGKLVRVLRNKGIGTLATDRANKRMFSSAGEIWDLDKLEMIQRVAPLHHRELAISADGTRAASAYPLRVWDAATGKATFAPPGHGFDFNHVAFTPDDRRIVTLSEHEGKLRFWDAKSGTHLEALGARRPDNQHHLRGPIRFTDDGKLIAGWELWNLKTKERLPTLHDLRPPKPIEWPYYSLTIAPNGKLAADWDDRKGVRLWNVQTCQLLKTVPLPPGEQSGWSHFAFAPDGKTLAVTSYIVADKVQPTLHFIDVATAKITRHLRAEADMPGFPQYSQDGRWLVFNRREKGIEIWHAASGLRIRAIVEQDMPTFYSAFAIAPHSQLVAMANEHHDIMLYELATGQRIVTLKGHADRVASLAFSHDGRRLVSGSEDRTALVWSLDLLVRGPEGDEDRVWRELAGDAATAYPLLWALAQVPKQALPLVQKRMKPDPAADAETLGSLIADLGSPIFAKRRDATEKLRHLGAVALPALQAELDRPSEVEVRRRIEELLKRLHTETPPPDLLRDLRVIQWMEMIDARDALHKLAEASRHGPRAVAARDALVRLQKRLARE